MKSLKPSARENKRYLLVKGKNIKENMEKAILDFAGISGMSKTGLEIISEKDGEAVVAVNRQAVDLTRAALCIFSEKLEVARVSGTLKGLGG